MVCHPRTMDPSVRHKIAPCAQEARRLLHHHGHYRTSTTHHTRSREFITCNNQLVFLLQLPLLQFGWVPDVSGCGLLGRETEDGVLCAVGADEESARRTGYTLNAVEYNAGFQCTSLHSGLPGFHTGQWALVRPLKLFNAEEGQGCWVLAVLLLPHFQFCWPWKVIRSSIFVELIRMSKRK